MAIEYSTSYAEVTGQADHSWLLVQVNELLKQFGNEKVRIVIERK